MPYIFGKLWHLAIIWAIRKAFQCILQCVRFLLANHSLLSGTSETFSYIYIERKILTFSKSHLLLYVFPSEPHTGENIFSHIFGQPSGYKIYLSQIINQDQHKRKHSSSTSVFWTINLSNMFVCKNMCRLCLKEKFFIMFARATLNKRNGKLLDTTW